MKTKQVVIALAALLLLNSCSKNTPKEVAQEWLTDFYHMNFEDAKKYSTEETRTMLNTIESFSAQLDDTIKQNAKKVTISIKGVREEGDKAFVTFAASNDPTAVEAPLKLIKQNDKWLVQFTKSDFKPDENQTPDMGGSGVSITAGAPVAPADTTSATPADTSHH
ncbi:MAG: DUF4878 domain-containing protein [Chitinophagia bacterium]|nr:DUF4878 domain-containing protein [Chitinophagia bacterium]